MYGLAKRKSESNNCVVPELMGPVEYGVWLTEEEEEEPQQLPIYYLDSWCYLTK